MGVSVQQFFHSCPCNVSYLHYVASLKVRALLWPRPFNVVVGNVIANELWRRHGLHLHVGVVVRRVLRVAVAHALELHALRLRAFNVEVGKVELWFVES